MNKLLDLDIQRFSTSGGEENEYLIGVSSYTKTVNVSSNKVSSIYYKLESYLSDMAGDGSNIAEFTATSNNHRLEKTVSGRHAGASVSRTYYFNVEEVGAAARTTPILDFVCLHWVEGTKVYIGYHIDWKSIQEKYNYQIDVVLENLTNGETYYETVWSSQEYQDEAVFSCPVGNSDYKAHFRIIDSNTNTLVEDFTDTYLTFSVTYGNPKYTITNRKLDYNCSEVEYKGTVTVDDGLYFQEAYGHLSEVDTETLNETKVKDLYFENQTQLENLIVSGLTAGKTYSLYVSMVYFDPNTSDAYTGTLNNQFDAKHNNVECSDIRIVPHSTTADCYINDLRCYNGATITKVDLHFSNYDDPNSPIELTFTSPNSDRFKVSGLTAGKSYFIVCDIYNSLEEYPMSTYIPNDIFMQSAGNDLPFAVSVVTAPGGEKVTVTLQNDNYKVASIMNNGYVSQLIGYAAQSEGWEAKTETTIERLFKSKIVGTAYEEFFCQNKSTGATTSFLVDYQLNNTSPDLKGKVQPNFGLFLYQNNSNDGVFPPYIITYRYIDNPRAQEQYTVGSVEVCVGLREGVFLSNTHNGPIGFNFYEGSNYATREFTSNGTYNFDLISRVNGVYQFILVTIKVDKIGQVLTESDFISLQRINDSTDHHNGMYLRPKSTSWGSNSTINTFSVDVEVLGIDSIINVDGASLVSGETNTIRLSGSSNKTIDFTITASKDGKTLSHTYTGFIYEIGRQPTSLGISILYSEYDKNSNNVKLFALCYPTQHSLNNCYWYQDQNLLSKIVFYINNTEVSQHSTFFDSNLMTAYAIVTKDEISNSDTFSISMTSCKGSDLSNVITDNLKTLGYNATPDLSTNYYPGANNSPLHLVLPDGTVIDDATFIRPDGTKQSLSDVIKIVKV